MNNKLTKIVISCLVIVACSTISFSALAQRRDGREVGIKIYFPYDESYIDSDYMGNRETLHLIDSMLRDSIYVSTLSTIEVEAQSSPEGSVGYNSRLSERRRLSLKEYFTTAYPQIEDDLWSFTAVAENWELFHNHLDSDPNLPRREEILAISSGSREADAKEWLLKTLDGGKPWRYIKENILPSHRFGASVLFVPRLYVPMAKRLEITNCTSFPLLDGPKHRPLEEQKLLFAIKSNLVLDALSVVNLGVEIPIGERWSVVGEVVHPWWRSWPADFTMQIESYHGELKYWLGDRASQEQLQGWSVGAYGGWGRYDIQPFSRTGVQGYFQNFGLELGYAHPIARNLNLEYTIGFGYVSTNYEDYKMAYDTNEFGDIKVIPYPWSENRLKAILPTRCGVSLVWTIKNKRGGLR